LSGQRDIGGWAIPGLPICSAYGTPPFSNVQPPHACLRPTVENYRAQVSRKQLISGKLDFWLGERLDFRSKPTFPNPTLASAPSRAKTLVFAIQGEGTKFWHEYR
jgi:hypothetical protein